MQARNNWVCTENTLIYKALDCGLADCHNNIYFDNKKFQKRLSNHSLGNLQWSRAKNVSERCSLHYVFYINIDVEKEKDHTQ